MSLKKYISHLLLFHVAVMTISLVPLHSFARQPQLSFKHITQEEGLSNSTIETIFQDSRGFIWFGTRDGLNRYDGYEMVVYRNDRNDPNSISDSYIRYICEDSKHKLWVATNNGLNLFDPVKNTFRRFTHHAPEAGSLGSNMVNCVMEQPDGTIWVATSGGLNLYNRASDTFRHILYSGRPGAISDNRVNYLYGDKKDNIWIGTDNGLNRYNPANKTFETFYPSGSRDSNRGENAVKVIQEDASGNLWLGTQDKGLYLFDPSRKTFKGYRHSETNSQSLSNDQIKIILSAPSGNLWVGSINGGLDLFNPGNGSFYHYQNEPDNPNSLSQRTVSALFEDNQGNLWVGTHRGGVNLYTPGTDKFKLYRQENNTSSLSYNDVKAFYEDKEGNIWIGTDGGGLNRFNRRTNTFSHYRYNPYMPASIGSDAVLHITEDSKGNLWVGTWGGGLNLMDRRTGTFRRYVNDPANKQSISSNYIQKTFEDSNGNLWIATYYGGLNLFDRATGKFSRITTAPGGKNMLSGNNIVSIDEDVHHNIWIGTDDGGLNCYHIKTHEFTCYFKSEEKIPDLRVIFNDSKGRLWIGQAGLYLFDEKNDTFKIFTDKAGLSREFIKGITEDNKGNFWISTSNGLLKFNPETGQHKRYNIGDNLQGGEFEANAYLKTRDNNMYFGGINGFNSFYPDSIKVNTFIPKVYITGFQISNKKIVPGPKNALLPDDIIATRKIILSYKQADFSFSFAALNYTAAQNNQYAYKLEGLDQDWNLVGTERKASYTNLDPGTYTFRVKASNNDGKWNEDGTAITIIITPPFWKTWWFLLLLGCLVMYIVYFALKQRRKFELNKLEEKKKEEMHQVQLQLFTNISHELRTPLSLILGPVEKLKQSHSQPELSHYYRSIHRNALRMIGLINELMDFRKVEAGVLKLKVSPDNLSRFVQNVAEEFDDLALQKQIEFSFSTTDADLTPWFDKQILEKIILNLLNNSFKYTEEGGKITIDIFTSFSGFQPSFCNELILKNEFRAKDYFYIRVKDNGIGISKESIKHLFERYYRITQSHLGSGVGLAFVKSLTTLHKGDVYVYSERNQGTEIIIALPLTAANYSTGEKPEGNVQEGVVALESVQQKIEPQLLLDNPSEYLPVPSLQSEHILLVEDNHELRKFLKDSLNPYYKVSESVDGASGLELAKEIFPSLIISDVMMPRMNGIEFCKLIKEDVETSHIPFIMLTAKDAIESRIEGVGSGADFYFSKPVSIDLLLLTVRNIFVQKQKLKERYQQDYHIEAKELVHSAQDKEFMDKLLGIIESRMIDADFDVDALCAEIGMSRTKLYEKIKHITGQNIVEFIRTTRLRRAVYIMTHEDLPLSDVMYRVGIQTQSYFTKAFKKEFGKTPSQFLQEIKK